MQGLIVLVRNENWCLLKDHVRRTGIPEVLPIEEYLADIALNFRDLACTELRFVQLLPRTVKIGRHSDARGPRVRRSGRQPRLLNVLRHKCADARSD
jgi:hypothetical protein